MNIIIHEVAHAVVGTKHSHNKIWQKKCIELGGTGQCVEYPIEEFELKIREMYGNYETYCSKCKTKQYWWGKSGKRECCGKPLKEIKR